MSFSFILVTNLKTSGHPMDSSDVLRPHGSAESIVDGVGPLQDFSFG